MQCPEDLELARAEREIVEALRRLVDLDAPVGPEHPASPELMLRQADLIAECRSMAAALLRLYATRLEASEAGRRPPAPPLPFDDADRPTPITRHAKRAVTPLLEEPLPPVAARHDGAG
jgi:hypothetical protein